MTINTLLKAANDEICRYSGLTAFSRWRKINRIVATLENLDNRTLDDIGISRWQIHDRARQIVDTGQDRSAA